MASRVDESVWRGVESPRTLMGARIQTHDAAGKVGISASWGELMNKMRRARAQHRRKPLPLERARAAPVICVKEQLQWESSRDPVWPAARDERKLPERYALGVVVILSIGIWGVVWTVFLLAQRVLS